MNKLKIAFLDRDGTIIKDYPDHEWSNINEPEFLEGSIAGMQKLLSLNYQIIIITNQYLINDGIITEKQYQDFTCKFITVCKENNIKILDIYYCPHNDNDHCNCKKPKPGMILKALNDYNIDLNASIYCGDSLVDYQLAKRFKLPFYAIKSKLTYQDAIYCNSLLDVCQYLK